MGVTNIEVRNTVTGSVTITGVDKTATMNFTNQSTVVFLHNLNKYPSVTVTDSAWDECVWDITYDSLNQTTARFIGSFSWTIHCN